MRIPRIPPAQENKNLESLPFTQSYTNVEYKAKTEKSQIVLISLKHCRVEWNGANFWEDEAGVDNQYWLTLDGAWDDNWGAVGDARSAGEGRRFRFRFRFTETAVCFHRRQETVQTVIRSSHLIHPNYINLMFWLFIWL